MLNEFRAVYEYASVGKCIEKGPYSDTADTLPANPNLLEPIHTPGIRAIDTPGRDNAYLDNFGRSIASKCEQIADIRKKEDPGAEFGLGISRTADHMEPGGVHAAIDICPVA